MARPDVSPESFSAPAEPGRFHTARRADELAVVLEAVGIPAIVVPADEPSSDRFALMVRPEDAERARDQLSRFVGENRGWPPRPLVPPPAALGVGAALVYAALLVIAFLVQRQSSYGVDWLRAGSADAAMMRAGEWWRAITALSLHADAAHLAGNVVFGALFGVMLAQSAGAGAAWLTFVVAGGLGNLVNAWWQPPDHVAIGASTGVFSLLGAQVACDWMRRGRVRLNAMRRWAPIIMGVALLAWFGASREPHVDVAAHVLGFAAGLPIGALFGPAPAARRGGARRDNLLVVAALGLVTAAWWLAVTSR